MGKSFQCATEVVIDEWTDWEATLRIEEQYQDVLQNLECVIASQYRQNAEMTDYAVFRTYEVLIQAYTAEIQGRQPKPADLSELEAKMFQDVRSI